MARINGEYHYEQSKFYFYNLLFTRSSTIRQKGYYMFRGLCRCFTKGDADEPYDWRELLKEYPEYTSSKYLWHKEELCDYTEEEIKALDIDKLNFIYDSGQSFVKETHEDIKDVRRHAMILLGYLLTIMLAAIGVVLGATSGKEILIIDTPLEYASLFVALMSFIIIFPASSLFYDQHASFTYFLPDKFMEKKIFKHDEKLLKMYDIRTIQLMGCKNLEIASKMNRTLECCIGWSLAMPVLVALFIIVWKLWLWTAYNYAPQF